MARPIGTLGTIDTFAAGGRIFTDLSNLVILIGALGGGATQYSTLRKCNTSAGYQAPAATFRCKALAVNVNATGSIGLMYGDNDVGLSTASVPTTPIYEIGASGTGSQPYMAAANTERFHMTNFVIPSGKFPAVKTDSGTHFPHVYGYDF